MLVVVHGIRWRLLQARIHVCTRGGLMTHFPVPHSLLLFLSLPPARSSLCAVGLVSLALGILCWRDLNDWRSSLCRGACIHCAMRWLRGYTIPYTIQMSTCPSVLFSFFFSFLPPVWGARFTIRNTGGGSCSWFDWRARRQKQGGIDGGGGANAKLGGIGGMGWDINTSTFGEDVAATFSRECQGIAGLHRRQ